MITPSKNSLFHGQQQKENGITEKGRVGRTLVQSKKRKEKRVKYKPKTNQKHTQPTNAS